MYFLLSSKEKPVIVHVSVKMRKCNCIDHNAPLSEVATVLTVYALSVRRDTFQT